MGSSKKQTVGYWYKPAMHFGFCQGPIDAFLQFRGGDRAAWDGEITESGEIYVDAPELWGGTDSEGGIQGYCDVMFGEQTQQPNAYLLEVFGGPQSAFRGKASLVFKGGRYGAMNPYPKAASFKLRRILKGWDGDVCWYPEKAVIGLTDEMDTLVRGVINTGSSSTIATQDTEIWTGDPVAAPQGDYLIAGPDRYVLWNFNEAHYSLDGVSWIESIGNLGGSGGQREGVYEDGLYVIAGSQEGLHVSANQAQSFEALPYPEFPQLNLIAAQPGLWLGLYNFGSLKKASSPYGPWTDGGDAGVDISSGAAMLFFAGVCKIGGQIAPATGTKIVSTLDGTEVVEDDLPSFVSALHISGLAAGLVAGEVVWVAGTDSGEVAYLAASGWQLSGFNLGVECRDVKFIGGRFVMCGTGIIATSLNGQDWIVAREDASAYTSVAGLLLGEVIAGLKAMNPAHMIYDSLTSQNMQGEPAALINVASFTAAADTLFSEGFGLCTKYDPAAESVEEFRARICAVIGASCSRSRVNGQWYLDLNRGDYVLEDLPVLTDNDILEYQEEPSILDDAVNQVVVQWFDPELKEDRSTAPVHALGAIQATGGVVSETIEYREIPIESLALRVAARELRNKATPLKRFRLTCNRTPYAWRIGTYFRLQAPKRGIADMVCMVGDLDVGTLRSGAIPLVAVQDVFGMPSTTYVVEQPTAPTDPAPLPAPQQQLFEAPYVELASGLSNADLSALPSDAGYVVAVGTQPTSGVNYRLYTAASGEEFADTGLGDWCPSATLVESADRHQTAFTIATQNLLSRVSIGTAASWDDELVRVDALDAAAGTVVLGRGCGDTAGSEHSAGSRLFFYDQWGASDGREYSAGETVRAKLLTRTGSAVLDLASAYTVSVEMAARASRPYPPAGVLVNGVAEPVSLFGELLISWAHRDRVLQSDQLIDQTVATIGPEAGTTYNVYWYVDDVLVQETPGVSGASQAYTPAGAGLVRVEVESTRGGLVSWQRQVRSFAYSAGAPNTRITESGDTRITEAGDTRITE